MICSNIHLSRELSLRIRGRSKSQSTRGGGKARIFEKDERKKKASSGDTKRRYGNGEGGNLFSEVTNGPASFSINVLRFKKT